MGFTKLDSGIVHSSIWSEAYSTRVLWVTMLAMCDMNGFVAASRPGLIRAANITEIEFDSGIATLEDPDPDSRSSEHDGRRVEKCEGGWLVLNHAKYRAFSPNEGDPNSPGAVRVRRWREKHKNVTSAPDVTGGNVTSVTSASASASASELFKQFLNTITPEDRELWKVAYPACDVDIEAAKASDWIISNPTRGRKSNYRWFFTGWLKRSQDRGGTIRTSGRGADFESAIDRIKIGREKT